MDAVALQQVRQTLLADPRRINARDAALRVLAQRFKCDPDSAKDKLAGLKRSDAVADLFQKVMPEEYKIALARSHGSRFEAASEFLPKLGFPIIDFPTVDLYCMDIDPFASIPIVGQGFHFCDQYTFENLRLSFQLGLQMNVQPGTRLVDVLGIVEDEMDYEDGPERQETVDFWWTTFSRENNVAEELRPVGDVSLSALESVFTRRRDPLRFLPTVRRVITYSTGSIFMDFDPGHDEQDFIPEVAWSRDNVVSLRREHALAQTIWANINTLDDWLTKDPTDRITKALRLYAKARKLTDEKPKRRPRSAARIRVF